MKSTRNLHSVIGPLGVATTQVLLEGAGPAQRSSAFSIILRLFRGKKCIKYTLYILYIQCVGFPGGSDGKESACNMGDLG